MENPADPLLIGAEPSPALNDVEHDAVIKVAAAGGKLARHQLGGAVLATLFRARVVASAGPNLIELTPRGVQALADGLRRRPVTCSTADERLFNARVLLEHAVQEIRAATQPDQCELGLDVSAVAEILIALRDASRRLGVNPPDLADLRPWALTLIDQATRPRRRGWLRPGRLWGLLP